MSRILVCVDDTDDLTKETSTGAVAESIANEAKHLGGSLELEVSRHQLLLAENVPYTSHNSSMAFVAKMPERSESALWEAAVARVRNMMSTASDPGLCMAVIPEYDDDNSLLYELIAYGQRCKAQYVSKAEAYELAGRIPWVRLEELGGDGQGVVGALAGAGLRLGGNDGRFRGKWSLKAVVEGDGSAAMGNKRKGSGGGKGDGSGGGKHKKREIPSGPIGTYLAGKITDAFSNLLNGRACVMDTDGNELPDNAPVAICDDVKPVLHAGKLTIVVRPGEEGVWVPCDKVDLEELHGSFADFDRTCSHFEPDNDLEEALTAAISGCPNCLYRRWTSSGFTCMKMRVGADPVPRFERI